MRIHYSRYWRVTEGDACVEREGDWTSLRVREPSVVKVEAGFGLDAMLGAREQCSSSSIA